MIAIDPGKSGGIAWISSQGEEAGATKMPATDRAITDLFARDCGTEPSALRTFDSERFPILMGEVKWPISVYLEGTVKYTGTKMPGSAGIVYGDNCGFVRGVLTAIGYRIVIVPPKTWQKALGLGTAKESGSKTVWKNKLKNRAEQLFPNIKVTLATADALLILEAARRGLLG